MESRILKALQPQLCLDPTPKFDRLCNNPVLAKVIILALISSSFTGKADCIIIMLDTVCSSIWLYAACGERD